MKWLNDAAYLSLATFRRSGAEVRTPVWFAREASVLYIFRAPDAGKVKRLRAGSRVRIAPCDVRGGVKATRSSRRPAGIARAVMWLQEAPGPGSCWRNAGSLRRLCRCADRSCCSRRLHCRSGIS